MNSGHVIAITQFKIVRRHGATSHSGGSSKIQRHRDRKANNFPLDQGKAKGVAQPWLTANGGGVTVIP